jgi:hypothetical protein
VTHQMGQSLATLAEALQARASVLRHQMLLRCMFSLRMTPCALGSDAELRRGLRLIA